MRKALDESVLPGNLTETDLSSFGNAQYLITQCWDRNPLLRPTAASAAESLLDMRVQLAASASTSKSPSHEDAPNKPNSKPANATSVEAEVASGTGEKTSATAGKAEGSDDNASSLEEKPQEVELVKNSAWEAIKQAREANEKKLALEKPEKVIPPEQFQSLFAQEEDLSPADNFLIGAIVYWNLSEGVQEILSPTQPGSILSGEGKWLLKSFYSFETIDVS